MKKIGFLNPAGTPGSLGKKTQGRLAKRLSPHYREIVPTAPLRDLNFEYFGIVNKSIETLQTMIYRVPIELLLVPWYHNSATKTNSYGGSNVSENYFDWIQGREFISAENTELTKVQIESAANQMKQRRFHLFSFNCEHFTSSLSEKNQ